MLRALPLLVLLSLPIGASAAELSVIETLPLTHARNLAIAPDGSELYVQYETTSPHIAIVDTSTNALIDSVPYGGGYLMDISPDGSRLYLAGAGKLEVIDLIARTALAPVTIPGAASLAGVTVSPDGTRVYLTDYGTSTGWVYEVDTVTLTYVDRYQADAWGWPFVMGIDLSSTGSLAYAASRKYGHLDVVDLALGDFSETISLGFGSSSILANVRLMQDGSKAYVTNVEYGFIAVVDTEPSSPTYHRQVDWFNVSSGGLGRVSFSQDGHLTFVTEGPWGSNRVFVIDTDEASPTYHSTLYEVEVGTRPWDVLGFEQDNQIAYATVWDPQTAEGGNLSVLGFAAFDEFACDGFLPPAAAGPITVKKNRAIPLKATILDAGGILVGETSLTAAPVAQVVFTSPSGGDPVDVTDSALPAGASSDGNEFAFDGAHWQFNLKTSNYTAAGTYTVSMVSGDELSYELNPGCAVTFVIN